MFKNSLPILAGLFGRNPRVEVPYYGVLNDEQIRQLAEKKEFIAPYESRNVKMVDDAPCFVCDGEAGKNPTTFCTSCDNSGEQEYSVLSFGTSSFGYDFTLADEIYLLTNKTGEIFNVKAFDLQQHTEPMEIQEDEYGRFVILPPHSFVLGRTVEYIKMPEDVVALCFDKSTYARIGGVQTNVTPLEPGWEGQVTLEIRNTLPSFTRLYVGEGIIQAVFFRGMRPAVTYADKKGKYQGQTGVTGARV